MRTKPAAVLSTLGSFPQIRPERLSKMARELSIFETPARKTRVIDGDNATDAYLLLSGAIKVAYPDPLMASILAPGEIFGLCNLIPGGSPVLRYQAITDSAIGQIPAALFSDTLFNVSLKTFGLLVNFVLSTWWTGVGSGGATLGRLPLRSRLSRALLEMGAKFGTREPRGMLLNLPVTQKDLADLIGSSRPQVSVHLAKLSDSGALIRKGRRLILVESRLREEAARAVFTQA